MSKTLATRSRKMFTELPQWKVLSRSASDHRSEVTVYVKGFLAEGDSPENFDDWLHSHRLLVLSPKHKWGSTALGYSWPSGTSMHHIPVPLASLSSAAYLIGRNYQHLKHFRFPTPLSIMGAVAIDVGLHIGRLAYQYNVATKESEERAEMLAWRLLELRRKYDHLRVVGHSLGCRHIVEACGLMQQTERPDSIHLCAPAFIKEDLLPWVEKGTGGLGQEQTVVYYSHKDLTLGVLLRTLLGGTQAVGEIGLPNLESHLDPSVTLVNASRSLGGYYIGAHTDYADNGPFGTSFVFLSLPVTLLPSSCSIVGTLEPLEILELREYADTNHQSSLFAQNLPLLNDDQKHAFDRIADTVNQEDSSHGSSKLFFVNGPGDLPPSL